MLSSLGRALWFGVLLPLLGTVALLAAGTIWPFRLDHRTLQDLHRVQDAGLPTANAHILFLTRDNSLENSKTYQFALKLLAFPKGKILWAALAESSNGPWYGDVVAVDSAGIVQPMVESTSNSAKLPVFDHVRPEAELLSGEEYVLYDSTETRSRFEERWPFLREAGRATVLKSAGKESAFTHRSIKSVFSIARLFRLTALLAGGSSLAFVLLWVLPLPQSQRWLAVGGAIMLGVGLNFGLAYLLQWLSPKLTHFGPVFVCIGSLIVSLACVLLTSARETSLPWPARRGSWLVLGYALGAYLFLFLLRHNFDGDFFYNWLPQARNHYLHGEHDPVSVLRDTGTTQGATYPPGYGISLSLLFWAMDLDPSTSFLCSEETSFAILTYRLLIWMLNTALMLLLGSYLAALNGGRPTLWILGMGLTLLLLPSTAGAHIAAETLLFPLLASAVILIAAGRNLSQGGLTTIGLVVGALATLVKWEGAILFLGGVLPWLLAPLRQRSGRPTMRELLAWAAVLLLALTPVLLWKVTLKVHNDFFSPVTWQGFWSGLPRLPPFVQAALRLTWENGRLVVLLALPLAFLARCAGGSSWSAAVIPVSVYALSIAWVVIFLFANIYPLIYLETSYHRLIMLPTFSAVLYGCEALAILSPNRKDEELG